VITTVAPAGRAYRGRQVQLDLITLAASESLRVAAPPADEAVVVLLEGSVRWQDKTATRRSVFDDHASALYLPPGHDAVIEALADTDVALVATASNDLAGRGAPALVGPADVCVHHRGRDAWTRAVHDVVVDNVDAQRLMVGETFNQPGGWSSFPPHKHDGRDGEPQLEEVYAYRFDRPDGFGFQGVYDRDDPDRARAELIRHGSVVGFDRGFHPVCAAPGYRLYYLWALAGPQRQLAMFEDPAHTWLNNAS
jgi:5-deoxy-glucuronate isomerase